MKKVLTVMALFVLAQMMFGSGAQAKDVTKKWELSGMGSAIFPADDQTDTTWYAGGRLTYDVTPNLAFGVESGYTSLDLTIDNVGAGDLRVIPVLADVILKYPIEATDNAIVPYIFGGVGAIMWHYNPSSTYKSLGSVSGNDTVFGGKVGGGVDCFLNENIAVFVEGSYLWSGDIDTGSIQGTDLHYGFAGAGIKLAL